MKGRSLMMPRWTMISLNDKRWTQNTIKNVVIATCEHEKNPNLKEEKEEENKVK